MKYRLIERIGSGGMAEVFRATGVGPDGFERAFIIKRIHPRLSQAPEFVSMFVHEAKILARLIHPNIVQVFELAYYDGAHYMVMEPVEGMDMSWLLRRRRERPHESLSPAFVAEVARQAGLIRWDLSTDVAMMTAFIAAHPKLWNEDIGT